MNKLAHESRSASRYAFAALIVLAGAALLLLGWQSGSDSASVLAALLLLVVGVVPNGLGLARWLVSIQASRRVSKRGAAFPAGVLAALGAADIAIIDTTDASKNMAIATAVTVGRTTYTTDDTGYEPTGGITDENGKAVTRKQLADLKLLFEACTYIGSAAVLRPDTHHRAWHIRGNLYEAAALVLARKAGLNTEQLQTKHQAVRTFPYDAGRQLGSTIRHYGNDTVIFVRGNPAAVLKRSQKLWDHGHVRSLSAGDKAFFAQQFTALTGKAYMALAYRILPDTVDPDKLGMDAAEQDLTFLGVVTMEHASAMDGMVAAARAAGLMTSTLTAETHPDTASSADLRKMPDVELVALLRYGGSFSRLAAEDILRLVTAAQHAGYKAAVLGNSLASLPARTQAEAGFTLADGRHPQPGGICDAAGLTNAVEAGRSLFVRLMRARHLAVVQCTAVAAATLFSAIGLFYYRVPLVVSLGAVLVIQLVVFPLAAYALPPTGRHRVTTREFAAAGSVLGLLTYGGFLYSFSLRGISPSFISPASRFTLEAVTTAAAIFASGLLAEVLLVHYQAKAAPGTRTLLCLSAAVLIVINLVYNPWLQSLFGISGLTPADWLAVGGAVVFYTGFRLFQHHTRRHTREAVLRLHRETYGTS